MTNPILGRVERDAQRGYAGFRESAAPQQRQGGYGQPQQAGYAPAPHQQAPGPYQQGPGRQPQPGYGDPGPVPGWGGDGGGGGRAITLDDVLLRTAALFAVLLSVGAAAWTATVMNPALGTAAWAVGIVGTLGIGIYLMFRKTPVGPALATVYAAFEGLFVGAISANFRLAFDEPGTPIFESIVTQAVLATLCVFGAMLLLFRTGVIKVTQKFRSIVSMLVVGYFFFMLINLGYVLFFDAPRFGFGGSGWLGIALSLFGAGLAAVMLTLDFDSIETAIRHRLPQDYAWHLSIGLVTTLVWLYIEMLRLLGRLRSE